MVGELERSGIGTPTLTGREGRPIGHSRTTCAEHNTKLKQSLREDVDSDWLLEATKADARLGRMSDPTPWDDRDDTCLLHPRFVATQNQADGSVKRRAVDHFSWSPGSAGKDDSTNGFVVRNEKMCHDTLDALHDACRVFVERVGSIPGLFKADIDAAFRRIPVKPEHRWIAGIAFLNKGRAYKAMHFASPFGAVSSGHAWERIGAAIAHIAVYFLRIPVLRYVDDYFGPERPDCLDHAMKCFARLVRTLLGPDAIADRKLECGASLCILGVDICMSDRGFQCRPAAQKIPGWLTTIDEATASGGRLMPGTASKLAGKLSWGCSVLFRRVGRAMLRPIFDQQSLRNGLIAPELRRALLWWRRILSSNIAELIPWKRSADKHVHMFCDASGKFPHLGVVIFIDDEVFWTHASPPPQVLAQFRSRADNQIMGLELLAISLGLSTFDQLLRGRRLTIHSDNSGSEVLLTVCVCNGSLPSDSFSASTGCTTQRDSKVVRPRTARTRTMVPCRIIRDGYFREARSYR